MGVDPVPARHSVGAPGGVVALAFVAPPVIKLKYPAMIIVILIGVGAMIYSGGDRLDQG
ncbi:MAG: hypothetical protein ABIQ06_15755 [Caldimonas sp.]